MNLKEAIDKLDLFTHQQHGATFSYLFSKDTPLLKRTLILLQIGLSESLRQKYIAKATELSKDVQHAVKVIKSHHVLLENYRKGTPEQRTLATQATELFKRYNALVDISNHPPDNWKGRMVHFYCKATGIPFGLELKKIELPHPALIASRLPNLNRKGGSLQTHKFQRHVQDQQIAKVEALFHQEGFPHPLSGREDDAFRGKMLVLLEQHKIPFATPAESLSLVQSADLEFTQEKDIVSVKTTLYPYPGEEIRIKGAFQREPKALAPSVPVKDSFTLKYTNIQTGFPYPGQHHGGLTWADQLIPALPHSEDELPLLTPLLERKREYALQLHERGDPLRDAKVLLAQKREAFSANALHFLALHEKLVFAFLDSSERDYSRETVHKFFTQLKTHKTPFDYIADTHQIISENVLTRPYTLFQSHRFDSEHWDQKSVKAVLEGETNKVLTELLNQRGDETTLAYIHLLGRVMAPLAQQIMLQQLSEAVQMAPPMLHTPEQKIQSIVYCQLEHFLSHKEPTKEELTSSIEKEIALYHLNEVDDERVLELEVYFNTRYYEHLSRSKTE